MKSTWDRKIPPVSSARCVIENQRVGRPGPSGDPAPPTPPTPAALRRHHIQLNVKMPAVAPNPHITAIGWKTSDAVPVPVPPQISLKYHNSVATPTAALAANTQRCHL